MLPKISVIVPIYNVEKYLNRCLDSIINQTYRNLEIILINDGSTDNSYSIAKSYEELDSRIILLNQTNQGQAKARNEGLISCTGDYVLFVDSDDWIENKCVQICVETVQRTKSQLIIFDIRLIKQSEIIYEEFDLSIFNCHSGPCNKFYSIDLWANKTFPESYWYEDLGVIPIIVGKCDKKVKISEPLYNYDFTRQDSQSHQINTKRNIDILEMLDLVYQELNTKQYSSELEYLLIKHIVLGLLIRKATYIKNTEDRKYIIKKALLFLETRYPMWAQNEYYVKNNSLKSIIEKVVVNLMKSGFYSLSSSIWKAINIFGRLMNLSFHIKKKTEYKFEN
ncbi:glycosyltransferase family 2 protein [Peribacillus simplex]|uniref:glycosyltransferase family 2 protein n=1 Tax=Peribacillus simplex TaxID=1478 RepID=UPI0024C16011|nr:glycosyltransferase family 2 protein [Peribacillus simplex]WHX89893.1 glycosyltransferase family 2 protein [Peribacillus simplex]